MESKALAPSAVKQGRGTPALGGLSPGPGMAAKDVAAHQLTRIHNATVGIVAERGYEALMVRDVVSYAEVSTRAFYELFGGKEDCFLQTYELNAYFENLDDCYLAALGRRAADALAQAARAQTAASSWADGVYRAISALCSQVAGDRLLARVCLDDDFPPGSHATRSRRRLLDAITELLGDPTPQATSATPSHIAASSAAVWSLFHHHVIRDAPLHRQIAATLGCLTLAPAIGAPAAVAAIQREQHALTELRPQLRP